MLITIVLIFSFSAFFIGGILGSIISINKFIKDYDKDIEPLIFIKGFYHGYRYRLTHKSLPTEDTILKIERKEIEI
jgi:hypothetical protein